MTKYLLIDEDGSIVQTREIKQEHLTSSMYGVLTIINISEDTPMVHISDNLWEELDNE